MPSLLNASSGEDYAKIEALVEAASAAVIAAEYDLAKVRTILAPPIEKTEVVPAEAETVAAAVEPEAGPTAEKLKAETAEPVTGEKEPAHS